MYGKNLNVEVGEVVIVFYTYLYGGIDRVVGFTKVESVHNNGNFTVEDVPNCRFHPDGGSVKYGDRYLVLKNDEEGQARFAMFKQEEQDRKDVTKVNDYIRNKRITGNQAREIAKILGI